MPDWPSISQRAAEAGIDFDAATVRAVDGGSINAGWRVEGSGDSFFIKTNRADRLDMFQAEAAGLRELAATQTVRVPEPLFSGTSGTADAFLILEFIELGSGRRSAAAALGQQLADLHRNTRPEFGWDRDNTIGSTPQPNTRDEDWISFFSQQRLGFQLKLAKTRGSCGHLVDRGQRLIELMHHLFSNYTPAASLLHGDLWGGNWGADGSGNPVIFDPAVYYGDREADVAMTHLFGGFGHRFYSAYEDAWPLADGAELRFELYNLYHVINHYNLFGNGYLPQAESIIDRLLAEFGT